MPAQKYIVIVLVALSCLFGAGSLALGSDENAARTLRSASEIGYPPFCVVDDQYQAAGFSVDLLRASLKEVGRDVRFETGPWKKVKQSLVDGKVDVLPLVGRTPEREKLFDFTFPYLKLHGAIVVGENNDGIHALEDLRGKRVAVMEGDNSEEFIRRSSLGVELVTTPTYAEALKGLQKGEFDAVIMQRLLFFQLSRELGLEHLKPAGKPLQEFTQSFCFAVRKGNTQLLELLNEGLSIVLANGTFNRLYSQWILPVEVKRFGKSRIVVGGSSNYPPYEYLDKNNQPAGYNVELTRAIARELGMSVDIQLKPWFQIRQGLEDGSIDLVEGMFYSPERDVLYDFSPFHTLVSYVTVARKGIPLPESLSGFDGKSVVVTRGALAHDLLLARGKSSEILTVNSLEEMLEQVHQGRVDYAISARLPAIYEVEEHGWEDLVVGATALSTSEYCYASLHENADLLAAFSEGLSALKSSGEYRRIYNDTLGVYENPGRSYFALLVIGILSLGSGLAIALLVIRLLRVRLRGYLDELLEKSSEKLRLLEKVEERERQINLILNSTAEGIFGVNTEGFCVFFNRAAEAMLGYSERDMIGRQTHDVISHTDGRGKRLGLERCTVRDVLEYGKEVFEEDGVFWKKDGEWLNVSYHICPLEHDGTIEGAVVTFVDITEKKRWLEQRIRSGQLAALGELAAGVAHEINNPITGVINYAQLLLNRQADNEKQKEILTRIVKEGDRIAGIVRNLLNYARKDQDKMEILSLERILEGPLTLMRQQLVNDSIVVDVDFAGDLPGIYGNAQKLEQVILNLVSNARHALVSKYPEADPNKILRLSASRVGRDDEARVQLVVLDHGHGIPEEALNKVFNRFFTTKPAGVGTGLGLSIVHDILEAHGAVISVESHVEMYTKVTIEFPVAQVKSKKLSGICA